MRLNLLARFLVLVLVLIGLSAGGFLWWNDAISPVDPSNHRIEIFVVSQGDGVRSIASRLSQQNLIHSPTGFYLMVKLLGIERNIQAGDYRLSRAMDAGSIAKELTHGVSDIWVTLIEGWRKEEVATKLAKELNIPEAEFLRLAKEGYMFPDTYSMPESATAGAAVDLFYANFDKKFTKEMRADLSANKLSLAEAVILASIVEREGINDGDRPIIAGILIKRWRSDWPLQADASVQYALGYQTHEKTWWKKSLTLDDLQIDSHYNTYKYPGLPPGPISNPGLLALQAVVNPQTTEYWYYLHDAQGKAHYAKTLEEHQKNVAKYLKP